MPRAWKQKCLCFRLLVILEAMIIKTVFWLKFQYSLPVFHSIQMGRKWLYSANGHVPLRRVGWKGNGVCKEEREKGARQEPRSDMTEMGEAVPHMSRKQPASG